MVEQVLAEESVGVAMPRTARSRAEIGRLARAVIARYGLAVILIAVVAAFSLARPHTFATLNNARTILDQAAPALVLGAGLTVVLVMQDFDLSFGSMIGLANGLVVVLIVTGHVGWPVAIAITLLAGVAGGLVNGLLVAGIGGSSFVVTLAMGTAFTGLEYAVTGQKEIFQGLPPAFLSTGQHASALGLNNQVWVALAVCLALWGMLQRTEAGRYMHAIGGNAEAAALAGVPTRALRAAGFVIVALAAAVVGILLSALTASYTPNIGPPYLLPGYAAVFLGAAAFRPGQFNLPGTVVGVLLLGVIQTGLTMLGLQTFVINLVQAAILVCAVVLSRLGARIA
jgi:ribose transport system permease protein